MELVPGRSCGDCRACCNWLPIAEPDIQKHGGEDCCHLGAAGCGIYDRRPDICRTWFCGWRYMGHLNDDWRPDRSNILISIEDASPPPGYANPVVLFMIWRDIAKIEWPPFLNLVGALVEKRAPVYLAVPVDMQRVTPRIFLNKMLAEAVARRDLQGLMMGLMRAALVGTTTRGPMQEFEKPA